MTKIDEAYLRAKDSALLDAIARNKEKMDAEYRVRVEGMTKALLNGGCPMDAVQTAKDILSRIDKLEAPELTKEEGENS